MAIIITQNLSSYTVNSIADEAASFVAVSYVGIRAEVSNELEVFFYGYSPAFGLVECDGIFKSL